MENEYIRIATEEIREGREKGDASIVWKEINEMQK